MITPMRGAGRDRQINAENGAPFNDGDRVVISPSCVENFFQPLRNWGAEGRQGTVTNCFMMHGGGEYLVTVQFDTKRPPKWPDNFVITFRPDDLQLVAAPQNPQTGE